MKNGPNAKTMTTTKAYFNRFKKAFLLWREKFGLTQYQVYFHCEPLDDEYARIAIGEQQKVASVYLNSVVDARSKQVDEGPESHAKHEALHLLLHRIEWLGSQRWTGSDEIHDEAEAAVNRLMQVLK